MGNILKCYDSWQFSTFSGYWRHLHWQKMSIHWKCQHSWTYIDWTCSEHENETNNCYSTWLPSFHQKIPKIRETTQELGCSHVTMFPVSFQFNFNFSSFFKPIDIIFWNMLLKCIPSLRFHKLNHISDGLKSFSLV